MKSEIMSSAGKRMQLELILNEKVRFGRTNAHAFSLVVNSETGVVTYRPHKPQVTRKICLRE